jgi:hypothetical protein
VFGDDGAHTPTGGGCDQQRDTVKRRVSGHGCDTPRDGKDLEPADALRVRWTRQVAGSSPSQRS